MIAIPTQPICASCWLDMTSGAKPERVKHAPEEPCCKCGQPTSDGIYVRLGLTPIVEP